MHSEELRDSNNSYGWEEVARDPPASPTVANPPAIPVTGIEIRPQR